MMKILAAGFVVSAITLGTLGAFAAAMEPAKMGVTSKGKAWTDVKGMTLYTFEKDTATSPIATANVPRNGRRLRSPPTVKQLATGPLLPATMVPSSGP